MNNRKLFLTGFCITLMGISILGIGRFVLGGQLEHGTSSLFRNMFITQASENNTSTASYSVERTWERSIPATPPAPTAPTAPLAPTAPTTQSNTTWGQDDFYTTGEWHQDGFSCTLNPDIYKLDVDIAAGNLIIKEGDTFSITGDNIDMEGFKMYPDRISRTLIITAAITDTNAQYLEEDHWKKSLLTITIPKDSYLDHVYVNNRRGTVDVTKIRGNDMIFLLESGSLQMDQVESCLLNVSCILGDITVTNTKLWEGLQLSCNVGEIFFTGEVMGDVNIINHSGNVRVSLANDPSNFTYVLDINELASSVTFNNKKPDSFPYLDSMGDYTFRLTMKLGQAKITF